MEETRLLWWVNSIQWGDHGKYKEKAKKKKKKTETCLKRETRIMRYTGVSSSKNEARAEGKRVRYHTVFEEEEDKPRAQKWEGHRQLSPWAAVNRSNKRK